MKKKSSFVVFAWLALVPYCSAYGASRPEDRQVILWQPPAAVPLSCPSELAHEAGWSEFSGDKRIPKIEDLASETMRRIHYGDRVVLFLKRRRFEAVIGRVLGFMEDPRDESKLLIGLFGSVYTSQTFSVAADLVDRKSSTIQREFSDEEWLKYEDQITLPLGPPSVNGRPTGIHPLAVQFFHGRVVKLVDGQSIDLTKLPSYWDGPPRIPALPRLGDSEFPKVDGEIGRVKSVQPKMADDRYKRRVRKGDLLVTRLLNGQEICSIVVHVSYDAYRGAGHTIKLLHLHHWESFFSNGALAWDNEVFGRTIEANPDSYILPLDWALAQGRGPLEEFLR